MNSYLNIQQPVTVCKASAGTGKTYTLAAYYVGLLLSGEDYRSILAITFTNKATSEMSERILTYLYAVSLGQASEFLSRARQFMLRDASAPDELLAKRAGECFRRMLEDYDGMHVMTIDSFLQNLLNGLAYTLHTTAGTTTELDVEHVIKQAVDQLMTTDLTPANLRIIEQYTHYRLTQETSWDIRQGVSKLAVELYNEAVQLLDSAGQIDFDASNIAARRARLENQWATHPDLLRIKELLAQIETYDLSVTNGTKVKQAVENIRKSITNPKAIGKKEDRFRGLTAASESDMKAGKWPKVPQAVQDMILEASKLVRSLKADYYTTQLSIALSRDMELMASLRAIIYRNLEETNTALLARTASILSEALAEGDADFILEKAGIRYRHILMDEFQDTSQLQWTVIRKLLQDVLASEGNTLLIVGDIKQSIYRWRNGDWHIMDALTAEGNELTAGRLNTRFTSLTRNFRSSEQVVRFNLSLFQYIIDHYSQEIESADESEQKLVSRIYGEGFTPDQLVHYYQADRKRGGYVCVKTFEGEKNDDIKYAMAMEMFDTIEHLLSKGMKPSDCMILVRAGKTDIPFLTRIYNELDSSLYPHLAHTPIVSERSFLLDSSTDVNAVISALKWAQNHRDDVSARYVEIVTGRADLWEQIEQKVTPSTPLYEAVCELIKLLLTDDQGCYHGSQTAYLNCLLDNTRVFVKSYGSRIPQFLEYWDDTLSQKSIPASSFGAIPIMTIHKSKGLQSQTLFVPFCHWEIEKPSSRIWCPIAPSLDEGSDYIPIECGDEMDQSAYHQAYQQELQNARVDSLNMLYVALTRAEDNLYVYTSRVIKNGEQKPMDHVGRYIHDCIEGDTFETGQVKIKQPASLPDGGAKEMDKPFAFDQTSLVEDAELWASSDQVHFIQSQEGAMYTDYGDEEAYRRVTRMDEGTLCHEIFARIRMADQLEAVLDDFESQGQIRDAAQRAKLRELISSAWNGNEMVNEWFTSPWELKLEEPIFANQKEIRPDRVMINPLTNEAIVLDYKFGKWKGKPDPKYIEQVQRYMRALHEVGHSSVKGYLWYARKEHGDKLIEVHEK